MSHHFATPTALGRYTAEALRFLPLRPHAGDHSHGDDVNSATTAATAAPLHDESLYVFDTVGDTPEDVSLNAQRGAVVGRDGSEGR